MDISWPNEMAMRVCGVEFPSTLVHALSSQPGIFFISTLQPPRGGLQPNTHGPFGQYSIYN
jgi:hypothetical protein